MSSGERRIEQTGLVGTNGRAAGDRREHPRVAMLSNVTMRIPTTADHAAVDAEDGAELIRRGRSGDVSLGGMFVESSEPMAPGTRVEASFEFPDSDMEVAVPAEVRWTRKPGMVNEQTPWKFGIRFLELSDQQQDLLSEFVAQRREN